MSPDSGRTVQISFLGEDRKGLKLDVGSAKRPSFAIEKEGSAREAILQHLESVTPDFFEDGI
jgi:hypothetical protein